jgi:hypothetical protein
MKTIAIVFCFLLMSAPSYAEIDVQTCIEDHQSCIAICMKDTADKPEASCVAQCALGEAKCVGHVGIKKSEPFLRKKAEELENFLNDFLGDILPEQEQQSTPPHKKEGRTDI